MEYKLYPEFQEFELGLNEIELNLSDSQKQQFMDYYEMLIERNKVMNLTAITEVSEVIKKHFIDSLMLIRVVALDNQRLLDLGTGAGFPGIPLKIAFPDLEVVLLDSLNKRLIFLQEVIEKLKLKKIMTLHGRAEDYGKNPQYREKFDICVSRAVAKLSSLSEYCIPYVNKDGFFISYKSGKVEEELISSERALRLLGGKVERVRSFLLPGTDIERSLIVIKKVDKTPGNYPRGAGKPSKEPL